MNNIIVLSLHILTGVAMNLPINISISFYALLLLGSSCKANSSDIATSILPSSNQETTALPDFLAIRDVRTKKQEFFEYLLPLIRQSNLAVLAERTRVLALKTDIENGVTLDKQSLAFIGGISSRYRVSAGSDLLTQINQLIIKVDAVPESLVLAQAANESGWGTSRFARKANNLFGVWCFKPGCGLAPRYRDKGLKHEVARYDSVGEGIDAYIHNINTHPAYINLRSIRAKTRNNERVMNGLALAEGLVHYSARGYAYVREIQQLIRVNKLNEFNQPV